VINMALIPADDSLPFYTMAAFGQIFEFFQITSRLAGFSIGVIVCMACSWLFTRRRTIAADFVFPTKFVGMY
jgi:hypothetical protein